MSRGSLQESGVGNVTSEIKFFKADTDNPVARIGVAINLSRKNGSEWEEYPVYRDLILFGAQAKRVQKLVDSLDSPGAIKGATVSFFGGSVEISEKNGKFYTQVKPTEFHIQLRPKKTVESPADLGGEEPQSDEAPF